MSSSFSFSLVFFLLCEEVKFVSVFLNGFVCPILALILYVFFCVFFYISYAQWMLRNAVCKYYYVFAI